MKNSDGGVERFSKENVSGKFFEDLENAHISKEPFEWLENAKI